MSDETEVFASMQAPVESQHGSPPFPLPVNQQNGTIGDNEGGYADIGDFEDQPESSTRPSPMPTHGKRTDTIDVQDNVDEDNEDGNSHPPSADIDRTNDYDGGHEPSWQQRFDWEDLERRFNQQMEEKYREEQEILQEFSNLTELYNIWAQTGQHQEQDRASKRLRTRIAYVQNSEEKLAERRSHHANVVQAFQSALQLLKGL